MENKEKRKGTAWSLMITYCDKRKAKIFKFSFTNIHPEFLVQPHLEAGGPTMIKIKD